MYMQKIDLPRVTCDLFSVTKGFDGNKGEAVDTGKGPRTANEPEARAYADFIRRKNNLPEIGEPALQHRGGYTGRGRTCHFQYVGATYGQHLGGGEYEPGAFSVLFPGANQLRPMVTLETLDEAGDVVSSQTLPVEPKKGGVVWSKDDVRKACGPVAKVKAARTPTQIRRAPTVDEAAPAPTAIQAKRTPAHERAIRRAWAERKTARAARFNVELARDMAANNKRAVELQRERAEAAEAERDKAMAACNRMADARRDLHKDRDDWQGKAQRADDARRLAESIAEDHLRMREEVQRVLRATEARLAAAEAENAELWAEIETLTAPAPALAA